MRYPLIPGQTIEYLVLHALECGMPDVWSVRKHLLLQGPDYMLLSRQISGALQRLKRDGIVANKSQRDRWNLVHNDNVTYVIEQVEPFAAGSDHYVVNFKPTAILPDVRLR